MQLKHLFKNFSLQDEGEQRIMVAQYRARRDVELRNIFENHSKKRNAATAKKQPQIALTPEEEALIKILGITKTQLRALKAAQMEDTNAD